MSDGTAEGTRLVADVNMLDEGIGSTEGTRRREAPPTEATSLKAASSMQTASVVSISSSSGETSGPGPRLAEPRIELLERRRQALSLSTVF